MGLSQDGPIGPSQQANPQDSPPMASRHPTQSTLPPQKEFHQTPAPNLGSRSWRPPGGGIWLQ